MSKRCTNCKGEGEIMIQHPSSEPTVMVCPECQGLGVPLRTVLEEQYEEASIADGTIMYMEEDRYIDFEEEDYEV